MIPIARPLLGQPEADAAAVSDRLSQGAEVAAFEAEFCTRVGASYACAVANGTVALHLALMAAGVGPGDEVITVSSNLIATANVVRQCGATPIFVDIQPDSFNIDPDRIAAAFSARTRAIVCVHQMGMPCDLAKILPLAGGRGVPVIEDAACAIGSRIQLDGMWQEIGASYGDVACYSFHDSNFMTAGEGGMLTTRHVAWDRKFRLWREHGMNIADTERHSNAKVVFEQYPVVGFNYCMTDIQAAIGRRQLERLTGIVAVRRVLGARYCDLLRGFPGVIPPAEPHWALSNWQSYCVRLPPWADQVAIMQSMLDAGVATRRGIMCAHLEDAYFDAGRHWDLQESESARNRCIRLPLYPQLSGADQEIVVAALRSALAQLARATGTSFPIPEQALR
jgi:dTDP-4-amino-4,6-dideoxygalactose transaminase